MSGVKFRGSNTPTPQGNKFASGSPALQVEALNATVEQGKELNIPAPHGNKLKTPALHGKELSTPALQNDGLNAVQKHSQYQSSLNYKNISPELKHDLKKVENLRKALILYSNRVKDFDAKAASNTEVTGKNFNTSKQVLGIAGFLAPPPRRLSSVPDSLEKGDYTRAAGMLTLAALNFPGDWREMELAGKELKNIKNIFNGTAQKSALVQHPLGVIKGTFLERERFTGIRKKLDFILKKDDVLYNTKVGKFINKTCNVQVIDKKDVSKKLGIKTGIKIYAPRFGGSKASQLIGRSLMRYSILGVAITSLLEIPAIIKAAGEGETLFDKAKSAVKQTCKAAGYLALVPAGIAVAGAAATMIPALAAIPIATSIVGMGIGSWLGLTASRELNKGIDNAFS